MYSSHLFLISSVSTRSPMFLSLIVPIFGQNVPLVFPIFLKRSLDFPLVLFSSIFMHCSLKKAFVSLLAILWNSAFYLSLSLYVYVCVCVSILYMKMKVTQLCLILCNSMDYAAHGILQARILEWVAFPFSRESSQPGDQTQVFHIADTFFISWATRETQVRHSHIFCYFIYVDYLK